MENQPGRVDAAAALDLVAASRARLADRIVAPWWHHLTLGLLVGGITAAQVASPLLKSMLGVGYAVGVGLLIAAYRRRTGLSVNAVRTRRARPLLVVFMVLLLVLYFGSWALHDRWGWTSVPIVAGMLMVPVTFLMGRCVDEAMRADLWSGR